MWRRIILLLIFGYNLQAQQWQWAKTMNLRSHDFLFLTSDSLQNFYLAANQHDYQSTTYHDSLYVLKGDSSGNELWRISIFTNGSVGGIATDKNAVYLSGTFSDSITIGGLTKKSNGGNDIFLAAFTPSGSLKWFHTAGGKKNDWGNGVCIDSKGNLYQTGGFSDTATYGDQTLTCACNSLPYVAKMDTLGNVIWIKQGGCLSGNSGAIGYCVTSDWKSKIYVAGAQTYFMLDTFIVGGGGGPFGAQFAAGMDTAGKVDWAQQVLHAANNVQSIDADRSGHCVMAGYGTWTHGGTGIVEKYDSSGQFLWDQSLSICEGQGYTYDAVFCDSNILSTSFMSTTNGCPGPNYGHYALFKIGSNGSLIYLDTTLVTSIFYPRLSRSNARNFYVAGMYYYSWKLGDDSLNAHGPNIFVARFRDVQPAMQIPIPVERTVTIFPNPTNGRIKIAGKVPLALRVIDVLGHSVFLGRSVSEIDLTSVDPGIYTIEATYEEGVSVHKVIRE